MVIQVHPPRTGSFRGATFYIDDEQPAEVGRRNALHEYPLRDEPYAEDLGRAARKFTVRGYVLEQAAVQALIDAFEAEGAGALRHPWYGNHLVHVDGRARVTAPRAAGGRYGFDVTFVEAGSNIEPDESDDTGSLLVQQCDDTQATLDDVFTREWPTESAGLLEEAANTVAELCAAIAQQLTAIDRADAWLDNVLNPIQSIISTPMALMTKWTRRIENLIGRLENPFSRLTAWRRLLNATSSVNALILPGATSNGTSSGAIAGSASQGSDGSSAIGTSSSRARVARTQLPTLPPALAQHVRGTVACEAARALPAAILPARTDLLAARDLLLATIADLQQGADYAAFDALAALRTAIIEHVEQRLPALPQSVTVQTNQSEDVLTLGYRVRGDLAAYDDTILRNHIRHPGLVPEGSSVEVLKG